MANTKYPLHPDAPLLLNHHRRPMTRRELIAQGFKLGGATLVGGTLAGLFNPARAATVSLSDDVAAARTACGIASQGAGKRNKRVPGADAPKGADGVKDASLETFLNDIDEMHRAAARPTPAADNSL